MRRHGLFLLALAVASVVQTGCGGGSSGPPPPPPPPPVTVTVAPAAPSIRANDTQQFTAAVTGTGNSAVTWTVNGVTGGDAINGTISAGGLYTAPASVPNPNNVSVRATSVSTPATSGTAAVTLLNPLPVVTSVNPSVAGTGNFQLAVSGTGFVSGTQIVFNGTPVMTTVLTSTVLLANVTASQAGSFNVAVSNPNPGGTTSPSMPLQVVSVQQVTPFAAARFLEQATFGPTFDHLNQLQQVGFAQWLSDQFNAPSSLYPDPDNDPTTNSPGPLQARFLVNALYAPDQLRQRLAFALQKIWVVSWIVVNVDEGFTSYLRMHQGHAFTNYRQIMQNVTLNPAMGQYQDIANNDRANPALGISCNENYGRELMQLFTIGVWQLNPDGTFILVNGNPVPTYDQSVVENNACALTGWTYQPRPGVSPNAWPRPPNFSGPLVAVESHHDPSAKVLLGITLPPNQTALQDLNGTLDNLFIYPSIAPFVSKLLIQQFVTSNPSPAYVQRVAAAFASGTAFGFGNGQRGEMRAIIAAILLDPEARAGDDPTFVDPNFGKFKEPVLFMTNLMRATGAISDGSRWSGQIAATGQLLFFPPTVFSYFSPEYSIPGMPLLGPEFQIQHSATTLARSNNLVNLYVYGALTGTMNSLPAFEPLAVTPDAPGQLLDVLNILMMHGTMSAQMRQSVLTAVNAVPAGANQLRDRVRQAMYLVATSSQYNVQR